MFSAIKRFSATYLYYLLCRMVMYWLKSRKEEKTDQPQYQRDFDLSPQGDHSMFWEYLEVGRYELGCSSVPELSLPCSIQWLNPSRRRGNPG